MWPAAPSWGPAASREALQVLRQNHRAQVEQILTQEQRDRLQALLTDEQKAQLEQWRSERPRRDHDREPHLWGPPDAAGPSDGEADAHATPAVATKTTAPVPTRTWGEVKAGADR